MLVLFWDCDRQYGKICTLSYALPLYATDPTNTKRQGCRKRHHCVVESRDASSCWRSPWAWEMPCAMALRCRRVKHPDS